MMRPIRMIPPLFFLFLVLGACTARKHIPTDTLVVALGSAPSTLDPRLATDANGMRIGGLIFDSLVRAGEDFMPAPEAAERWTYKNHVFTFYLRKDLQFHNGRAVQAEDVLFSFAEFRAGKSPFASNLGLIKDVKVRNEKGQLVVDIVVKNYSDKFLVSDLPAVRILPREEAQQPDFTKRLIGTGGYKFAKKDITNIHLEAVTAKTKHLIFKVIRDDFTRYQKMLKGEVDIVQADMPTDKVAAFEKRPDHFQVLRYPGLTMTYVLLNFRDPLLKSKAVRQALAQSLQRQDIIAYKLRGLGTEATSLLTPNNPYFNSELSNPPFDVAAAKSLIEKSGWAGKSLILKTSNQPQAVDNGKVIAHQMSEVGLSVQLQSFEWATFYDDVKKGNFQMATMKWVGTIDPDLYRIAFHSKELPPGRNRGAYENKELDSLLEKSATTENPEERKKIIHAVQKIVHDEIVIIPLWYDLQVAVAQKNILNYRPVQSGNFRPFLSVQKSAL